MCVQPSIYEPCGLNAEGTLLPCRACTITVIVWLCNALEGLETEARNSLMNKDDDKESAAQYQPLCEAETDPKAVIKIIFGNEHVVTNLLEMLGLVPAMTCDPAVFMPAIKAMAVRVMIFALDVELLLLRKRNAPTRTEGILFSSYSCTVVLDAGERDLQRFLQDYETPFQRDIERCVDMRRDRERVRLREKQERKMSEKLKRKTDSQSQPQRIAPTSAPASGSAPANALSGGVGVGSGPGTQTPATKKTPRATLYTKLFGSGFQFPTTATGATATKDPVMEMASCSGGPRLLSDDTLLKVIRNEQGFTRPNPSPPTLNDFQDSQQQQQQQQKKWYEVQADGNANEEEAIHTSLEPPKGSRGMPSSRKPFYKNQAGRSSPLFNPQTPITRFTKPTKTTRFSNVKPNSWLSGSANCISSGGGSGSNRMVFRTDHDRTSRQRRRHATFDLDKMTQLVEENEEGSPVIDEDGDEDDFYNLVDFTALTKDHAFSSPTPTGPASTGYPTWKNPPPLMSSSSTLSSSYPSAPFGSTDVISPRMLNLQLSQEYAEGSVGYGPQQTPTRDPSSGVTSDHFGLHCSPSSRPPLATSVVTPSAPKPAGKATFKGKQASSSAIKPGGNGVNSGR